MTQAVNQKSILLIDPDPNTEIMLRDVFSDMGFQVIRFDSGQEGLKAIPRVEPILIISEYQTVDIDGKTIFRTFRKDHAFNKFNHIPFIFLTNERLRDQNSRELFRQGLIGWYTKPFNPCLNNSREF